MRRCADVGDRDVSNRIGDVIGKKVWGSYRRRRSRWRFCKRLGSAGIEDGLPVDPLSPFQRVLLLRPIGRDAVEGPLRRRPSCGEVAVVQVIVIKCGQNGQRDRCTPSYFGVSSSISTTSLNHITFSMLHVLHGFFSLFSSLLSTYRQNSLRSSTSARE